MFDRKRTVSSVRGEVGSNSVAPFRSIDRSTVSYNKEEDAEDHRKEARPWNPKVMPTSQHRVDGWMDGLMNESIGWISG